jgi:hypothetical protein
VDDQLLAGQDLPQPGRIDLENIQDVGEASRVNCVCGKGEETDAVTPAVQASGLQVQAYGLAVIQGCGHHHQPGLLRDQIVGKGTLVAIMRLALSPVPLDNFQGFMTLVAYVAFVAVGVRILSVRRRGQSLNRRVGTTSGAIPACFNGQNHLTGFFQNIHCQSLVATKATKATKAKNAVFLSFFC